MSTQTRKTPAASFRLPGDTLRQIAEMSDKLGMTKTGVLSRAVDRLYKQERMGMKNETTFYVHEDMLGDIGTEAQARRMVDFLRERGYDVEYGQAIEQDPYAIADQDWYDGLDVLSKEMVE